MVLNALDAQVSSYTVRMMHAATPHSELTFEEYLEIEQTSQVKHEFVGGELHAFAGASDQHNRIAGNIHGHLWAASRNTACRVYMSDMKVRVADNLAYYPDVMVTCDPEDTDPYIKTAPCLLVEVLSPSTASTDLREKVFTYRGVSTLEAYVIVYQDERRVVRHWRDVEGVWRHGELTKQGDVKFPCPEITLSFDEIYEGIEF
jgi:Uma2 family endonuclease